MDKIKAITMTITFILGIIMIVNGFILSPKRQKKIEELYIESDSPDRKRDKEIIHHEIGNIMDTDMFYLQLSFMIFMFSILVLVVVLLV